MEVKDLTLHFNYSSINSNRFTFPTEQQIKSKILETEAGNIINFIITGAEFNIETSDSNSNYFMSTYQYSDASKADYAAITDLQAGYPYAKLNGVWPYQYCLNNNYANTYIFGSIIFIFETNGRNTYEDGLTTSSGFDIRVKVYLTEYKIVNFIRKIYNQSGTSFHTFKTKQEINTMISDYYGDKPIPSYSDIVVFTKIHAAGSNKYNKYLMYDDGINDGATLGTLIDTGRFPDVGRTFDTSAIFEKQLEETDYGRRILVNSNRSTSVSYNSGTITQVFYDIYLIGNDRYNSVECYYDIKPASSIFSTVEFYLPTLADLKTKLANKLNVNKSNITNLSIDTVDFTIAKGQSTSYPYARIGTSNTLKYTNVAHNTTSNTTSTLRGISNSEILALNPNDASWDNISNNRIALRIYCSSSVSGSYTDATYQDWGVYDASNSIKTTLTVYLTYTLNGGTVSHSTIKYYDGSQWKDCEVFYYTGSEWKQCDVFQYDGSEYKKIGG